MSEKKVLRFDDELIGQVSKLLQIAILTGTDIIDHMRMMMVVENDGKLKLDEEYKQIFNENINKMLTELEKIQEQMNAETVSQQNRETLDN